MNKYWMEEIILKIAHSSQYLSYDLAITHSKFQVSVNLSVHSTYRQLKAPTLKVMLVLTDIRHTACWFQTATNFVGLKASQSGIGWDVHVHVPVHVRVQVQDSVHVRVHVHLAWIDMDMAIDGNRFWCQIWLKRLHWYPTYTVISDFTFINVILGSVRYCSSKIPDWATIYALSQ
jgi:hypothetical protein